MRELSRCLLISLVSCVISYPISQPIYPNSQYVSAQVPSVSYKHPQAPGYAQFAQPPQYVRPQPAAHPVYEPRDREGLQNYASPVQAQQPIQQVLLSTNVDRQIQKAAQGSGNPYYLQQIQTSQLAAQAQDAFAAAQRKATSQTFNGQIQPVPVALPTRVHPQEYAREQPQPQPQQPRYISRPVQGQYRVQRPQQQQQQGQEENDEDYDPNPNYQFGFDVKDDLYTNYQNRKEQRDGNKITGSYSVVDSDGFIRTVSYTADPKEGFKAEVTRQPTDIVVKIPKPDPQFQNIQRPQPQPQQYIQCLASYIIVFLHHQQVLECIHYLKPFIYLETHSPNLLRSISSQSRNILTIIGIYFAISVMNVLLYMPWTGNEEQFIYALAMIKKYAGNSPVLIVLFYVSMFHMCYYTNTVMLAYVYFRLQVKFRLEILNEYVGELAKEVEEDDLCFFDDTSYQRGINRKLVYCIQCHDYIKRININFNKMCQWPILIVRLLGIIQQFSMLIYIFNKNIKFSNKLGMILSSILVVVCILIFCIIGQLAKNESEKVHNQLRKCRWYNWNKNNRDLLRMFLLHTQKPLTITAFKIITLDNELILEIFQAVYSLTMFYQSISHKLSTIQF